LPEILEGCAVLVPPRSPRALADGLKRLLAEPAEAEHLGLAARKRCQEKYSWDAMECVLETRLGRWT
jgi:glycosyltransferase involved in cell wall biosynthesis